MYSWKVSFSSEESPASNNLVSLFTKVEFEKELMPDIVDIDVLFSMAKGDEGYIPLFTCVCGSFGCGGYYIKVKHIDEGLILQNSYHPVNNPSEDKLITPFEHEISWEDLYFILSEVIEYCLHLKKKYPNCGICSGTYGLNIVGNLDQYAALLQDVRLRYEE